QNSTCKLFHALCPSLNHSVLEISSKILSLIVSKNDFKMAKVEGKASFAIPEKIIFEYTASICLI
ncbi:hypothetical protein QUF90_25830, partial [Desulfococcaceae bacterium HSG9]|nr:hypothetical protein [Desulfococcaceae bacterium HSG9]